MSKFKYKPVNWLRFARHFNRSRTWPRIAENCSTLDDTSHCLAYMSDIGLGGFAIHVPTGEIRYLHSVIGGQGDNIVQEAIKRGGTWLTCFDGYLVDLYQRHGFVITAREPNWTTGLPDVITMRLSNES